MRMFRIARAVPLALAGEAPVRHREVWAGLPETARRQALTVLAQMITRGVLDTGIRGEEP